MCWGISDFKKGYRPRTIIVQDEKSDLVTFCHSILANWRNHFSQLLNVHGVNDVSLTEIHKAELLVPEANTFEFEMAIEKLKRHRSSGIDQIPSELLQAVGRTICSEVNKLIISVRNKEELLEWWKELTIVPAYKKGDRSYCSNCKCISCLSFTYKILSSILLSMLTPYAEENTGNHHCEF